MANADQNARGEKDGQYLENLAFLRHRARTQTTSQQTGVNLNPQPWQKVTCLFAGLKPPLYHTRLVCVPVEKEHRFSHHILHTKKQAIFTATLQKNATSLGSLSEGLSPLGKLTKSNQYQQIACFGVTSDCLFTICLGNVSNFSPARADSAVGLTQGALFFHMD